MFPHMLCVSSFPDRFPHYAYDSGILSPLRLWWVKGVCVFSCNLPPALLAESLCVSSFPDRFPHYAVVGSRAYACLGVTCHLHFLQSDRGLLRATAVAVENISLTTMMDSDTCLRAYLYFAGTKYGNLPLSSVTRNRVTCFVLQAHT